MHFQGVDLNLLVALDAMLEERSVTRAANRLQLRQPAMSAALQRLRYHFSDALFERVGQRLELTPRAKALVEPVRNLLIDIRATLDATVAFDPKSSNRGFRLAMSSFTAELIMPQLSKALIREAPGLRCEISYTNADMFHQLRNGLIDCCITIDDPVYFDYMRAYDEFLSQSLLRDPFTLVAARDNPHVHEGMSYDELCALPLVIVRVGEKIRSVVEHVLDQQTVKPATPSVVPSYQLALRMISGSDMVLFARRSAVMACSHDLNLRHVAPPLQLPLLEDSLIWHMRTDSDAGHLWLRQLIRNTVHDLAEYRTP